MKKFKLFSVLVASIAVILLLIEGANRIHMMGFHFMEGGFSVVWKEDAPWQFIAIVRSWWYWVLSVVSVFFFIYLYFSRDKKGMDE